MPAYFQSRLIMGGLSILVLVAAYYTFFGGTSPKPQETACTAEAKQCPDGSYVGRTGPSCEFAACPTDTDQAPTTVDASFTQTITVGSIRITPKSLVEDSRCPIDVQCIQAGTVRIQTTIDTANGADEMILQLGVPGAVEGATITLIGVYPGPMQGRSINPNEYKLTFRVLGR